MENQALLSLLGVWRGDTGLLNQPLGGPSQPPPYASCRPAGKSGRGWAANALYQPIKPTDTQPEVATAKVAQLGHQPFLWTQRHGWHSSRLPLWNRFGLTALFLSVKTLCQVSCLYQDRRWGMHEQALLGKGAVWMDQAMKSKPMLSPSTKSSPGLQQAARIEASA